jgi:hypothetical protein
VTDYERGQTDMRDEIAWIIRATAAGHADAPAFADAVRNLAAVIGRFEPKQDPHIAIAAARYLASLL